MLVIAAIFCASVTCAQPVLPQRSISVAATQSMHFGSFCLTGTGGGTIVLGFDGSRSSTGAIYLSRWHQTPNPPFSTSNFVREGMLPSPIRLLRP